MAIIQNLEAFVQSYPAGLDSVTDLQLSQNENGRQIRFTIGGVTIPAGSVATISGTKPDGVVYSNTGTIEGADTVIFDEDVQMTAVFGTWYAKIRITNAGNTIASARVRFIIDKDPVDAGAIPSESQLDGLVAEAEEYAEAAEDAAGRAAITYGSPLTASTAAAMTDVNRVYVYTGSESGYTCGNWYYYNGSAWVSGGIYNSAAVETDTTLTESGVPADAKATGDKIAELKDDLSQIEGISNDVKVALLDCFDNVAWAHGNGRQYYNALYDALYSGTAFDYVWNSSNGIAPTGMTYDSISFASDNSYATIQKPILFAGFCDREIELEMAVVSGANTYVSLSSINKYGVGARISFQNDKPILIAVHDNYPDKLMPVDGVDIYDFNKYGIELKNGRVTFKINDVIISTGDAYSNAYLGSPIIGGNIPLELQNYTLSAKIKSIKYKNYGEVSPTRVLKYYRGKGVEIGTPNLVANTKRITTDLIYFPSFKPLTIQIDGLTENVLQYAIKIIDGNGNCWNWSQSDAYYQDFQKPNLSPVVASSGWYSDESDYTSITKQNTSGSSWVYGRLQITNGTVRLLFADGQSRDNELNRAISGSVFVNGEEYILEEGVYE